MRIKTKTRTFIALLILAAVCAALPRCSIIRGTYRVTRGTVRGATAVAKGTYRVAAGTTKVVYKIGEFTFEVVTAPLDWPLLNKDGSVKYDRAKLEAHHVPWAELAKKGIGVHCGEAGCYNKTPYGVF